MSNCGHQNTPLPERQTLVPTILRVWFVGDKAFTSSPRSYLRMREEALSLTHISLQRYVKYADLCWNMGFGFLLLAFWCGHS